MRSWLADPPDAKGDALSAFMAGVLPTLGEQGYGPSLLDGLRGSMPLASLSVYRTGAAPAMFFTASLGVPDTTQACWRAYLSGPVRGDRSFAGTEDDEMPSVAGRLRLCHITAAEVPAEHRAKVYAAHGVSERLSVVEDEGGGALFAVNFYRHAHQRPLDDAQLCDFGRLARPLMAMTRKHIALARRDASPIAAAPTMAQTLPAEALAARLSALQPDLTTRELEVCVRLLKGMTQEGIAVDLGLGLPTVKTYRNRAFARLGIHFRNELFALMLHA